MARCCACSLYVALCKSRHSKSLASMITFSGARLLETILYADTSLRRHQPLRRHNHLLLRRPHRARCPPLVPPRLPHLSLPPPCATESPGSPAPHPSSTQRTLPGVNSALLTPSIFLGKASAPTALPRWSVASTSTRSPPNADIWCVLLFHPNTQPNFSPDLAPFHRDHLHHGLTHRPP